jgi:hypothetical protein
MPIYVKDLPPSKTNLRVEFGLGDQRYYTLDQTFFTIYDPAFQLRCPLSTDQRVMRKGEPGEPLRDLARNYLTDGTILFVQEGVSLETLAEYDLRR